MRETRASDFEVEFEVLVLVGGDTERKTERGSVVGKPVWTATLDAELFFGICVKANVSSGTTDATDLLVRVCLASS